MMILQDLLTKHPVGAVKSVVCVKRDRFTPWVVGKVYTVTLDSGGNQAIQWEGGVYSDIRGAKFDVHELVSYKPNINTHMKDGKLPTLVTGFNPNVVDVKDCKPERSYEEIEKLIRVGIDIQDALATNSPALDQALVSMWFQLKGAK